MEGSCHRVRLSGFSLARARAHEAFRRGKIECGKVHFKALAVSDNPARYRVATRLDDLVDNDDQ
jgi:hypothetical protein